MHKKLLLVFLLCVLVPISLFAGTTGKISGRVVDKETGEPLSGANIMIEGTSLGAAADADGYYFIINIPPGLYSVRAQMIGYQVTVQKNVRVIVDKTTKINFQLGTTILEGEAVEVVAERPLLQKDQTASSHVATSEQIENMPVETFNQVMVLTPGFVQTGTEGGKERPIHVRGGRTGEMSYMIDGFYVEDPIAGGMGSSVANVGIAELAALTGTFNAEYGEALSGVLNIVTKEGGSNYEGRLRFRTDKYVNHHTFDTYQKFLTPNGEWVTSSGERVTSVNTPPRVPGQNKFDPHYWQKVKKKVNDFNTYRSDFYFGGPIPLIGKSNTFFASGEYVTTDTYLGWTGIPFQKDLRLNGKLILKPLSSMKLTVGAVYTNEDWKNYNHYYKYVPSALETNYRDDYMLNFTLTHTLSPKTFYTVKGSRFTTNYYYHMKDWTEKDFFSYQDSNGKWHVKNPDGTYTGKAERTTPDAEYEFATGWWEYQEDSDGNVVDSTWYSGGGNDWTERENVINNLKFDLTSQVSRVHQFKLGAEGKLLNLHFLDIGSPYNPKPYYVHYEHDPIEASAYLQDKMEFEDWGMVVNAGLRLDYMDTKAKYFADPTKPTTSAIKDAEKKMYISPRLGIAHPVTDKAVLHFAYGHFYQIPDYSFLFRFENMDYELYPYPDMSIDGIYTRLGNANLKPEKTIAYELGVETRLSNDIALDITAYYKDIFDYVAYERFQATPSQYHRYVNLDYANAKGIEIAIRKRFSNFFGGQFNYTFSHAEGNASSSAGHYNDWYSFSVYGTYPPNKTVTMAWDQIHTANFVLDFRKPNNWSVNVVGTFGSGLPYTPESARGLRLDEPNSARMPWTMTIDLRATKLFKFMGLKYTLFLDGRNLLNKRNVLAVWSNSGKPDATIDWDDTEDSVNRPQWLSPPRTIEVGLSVGF